MKDRDPGEEIRGIANRYARSRRLRHPIWYWRWKHGKETVRIPLEIKR